MLLIVELDPGVGRRHSNVVLTDVDGQIKLCAQQIGSKQSSVRQLQVGSQYK